MLMLCWVEELLVIWKLFGLPKIVENPFVLYVNIFVFSPKSLAKQEHQSIL